MNIEKIQKENNMTLMQIIVWILIGLFLIVGCLNILLVHPVPGIFYIVLALTYLPQTNKLLKKNLKFQIPDLLKIIFGLVVLWGTLAVGDLAELFGL